MSPRLPATLVITFLLVAGCSGGGGSSGLRTVDRVIDGDTIELAGGEDIRFIGIDTPERSGGAECWGDEAFNHLSDLIGDSKVRLEYDFDREDDNERTLAYVYAGDVFLNSKMLEDGAACILFIPPNGDQYQTYFSSLEEGARVASRGLWGDCGGCDAPAFAAATKEPTP